MSIKSWKSQERNDILYGKKLNGKALKLGGGNMGLFVNPDNSAFQKTLNSLIYVDKTKLIEYTNRVLNTDNAFICNSRPRRFGKSITANMLTAYYSRGCNSQKMFSELKIAESEDFKKYLNYFDVIRFDMQWCMMDAGTPEETINYINEHLIAELKELYPNVPVENVKTAYGVMSRINSMTGKKFVVIIDEWDVLIRDEASNDKVQKDYIDFLRGMFKGIMPTSYIALAYMTGILPIKKIRTESALNNFDEFTMIDASSMAPYIGFTEEEVRKLCQTYQVDFDKVKCWYDGYILEDEQIYNPRAVVSAMTKKRIKSYWSETGTYESIVPLINKNFDGLKTALLEMLAGTSVRVDVTSFQNDAVNFVNRDDVLTYLIHLGYLGYDQDNETAFVPNEEIRQELLKAVRRKRWDEFIEFQTKSEELLNATLDMDAEKVAQGIEKIHMDYASAIQYNNENSLSSVLTIAYLSAMQYYFKPVREMPAGRGVADFIFLPKPEYNQDYPALVVELKWNQKVQTAINQIKEKQYPASIEAYTGNILLVALVYDKKTKQHQCKIEKYTK